MTVQIMVLGCFHMNNPGRDIVNFTVGDVTTPQKQLEIREVADALLRFHPTKIALEAIADRDGLIWSAFEQFAPEHLLTDANERVQLGFRLAHALGHRQVYGIDNIGEFPYAELQRFAEAHGQAASLQAILEAASLDTARLEQLHESLSVREMLIQLNTDDYGLAEMKAFYTAVLSIGTQTEHPGAYLNAMWYLRNANIFSKLRRVALPSDRILVIFGAGHGHWLRTLVRQTAEYELIQANDFLTANLESV